MFRFFCLYAAIFLLTLTGCAKTQYHEAEEFLKTDGGDERQFHALVYYPREHSLRYPGLIIGIEKSDSEAIRNGATNQSFLKSDDDVIAQKTNGWLQDLLSNGRKSMFISHVIESDRPQDPCLIFNAYDKKTKQGNIDCDKKEESSEKRESDLGKNGADYENGWVAIFEVRKKIEAALKNSGRYTHVVFLTMGWNTNQVEAVQNFNSLVMQLKSEATEPFNPYVIGVTWPSQWDSSWFEPIIRAGSLINKANDADEIGAGWLGAILRYGVVPAARNKNVKLLVIGHSFGARATSHAVCRGTLLKLPEDKALLSAPALQKNDVWWLVGLQAAYSLNRFSKEGAGVMQKISYAPQCETASHLLFTASSNDSAGKWSYTILGAPFAGSIGNWNSMRLGKKESRGSAPRYDFYSTQKSAGNPNYSACLDYSENNIDARFKYIDASNIIKFNAYGTGAGAHSDIYRSETARMIWQFIGEQKISTCTASN